MMVNLKRKLAKHDLVHKFNAQVQDFFSRGVLKWVCKIPQLEDLQKSFIPLTYTLGKGKLRVCGNASFSTNDKQPSLNSCMLAGPAYLQSLEGILLRWRCGQEVAHADIQTCYHQIGSVDKDKSLRRVLLRPDGRGSSQPWQQACFCTVSFGDQLGGCMA